VPGDIRGSIAPDTLAISYALDARPFTGVVVYVYVDDIEASYARAVAAGAIPRSRPIQIGDRGYVCQLLDPEGNPFMMWQPPEGWEPDDWARSRG
jgi:predicted enzyme related to lactoylglutathione lyase